ncbi:MAG: nicotinate-nicotinamide nucleotide adenylyltransferase [Candidatus Dormibacteria bacterium]
MATRSGVVFGGTFDPVHRGHLEVIRGLRRELGLPVLVVPNGNPPHRLPPLASGPERLLMVQLALAELEDPLVETSEVELNRPGLSYTADTLAELAAADPERELLLALGSDAARGLPDWERPGLVLGRARLVVFDRLGTENRGSDVLTQLRRLGWPLPGAMSPRRRWTPVRSDGVCAKATAVRSGCRRWSVTRSPSVVSTAGTPGLSDR